MRKASCFSWVAERRRCSAASGWRAVCSRDARGHFKCSWPSCLQPCCTPSARCSVASAARWAEGNSICADSGSKELEQRFLSFACMPMTASPTSCLKCGHQFPLGAPEPSWCPDCGKLCSAYDVPDEPPEPDEIPETPQEQRGLKVWFWVLFLGGPIGAGLGFLFGGQAPLLMPGALQSFAPNGSEPLLA